MELACFFMCYGFILCSHITTFYVNAIINLNVFDGISTCEFKVGKITKILNSKQMLISQFGLQIKLSPCAPIEPTSNCDPDALVCVLSQSNKLMPNAGRKFMLIEHADEDNPADVQPTLKSLHGNPCAADLSKNYTTYIYFGRTIQSKLIDSNECEIFIQMLDPNIEIPCLKNVNGYLLDFRSLKGEMKIQTKNMTFFVNLCGSAKSCRDDSVSACQLLNNNSTHIIGSTSTQKIALSNERHVQISYKFGAGRNRFETLIYLKCNWNVLKSNGQYVIPSNQGKKYRFNIESYLGCIKLPMYCQAQDLISNFQYNLNGLYKPNSFWQVSNVQDGTMVVNMCGPLNNVTGICADTFSQICYTLNGQNYNYGSILTSLEVIEDSVKATLTEGSECPQNKSLTLNSNIVMKCSTQERGPKILEFTTCSVKLLWETPNACAHYMVSGNKCFVMDMLGKRDVSSIYNDKDTIHRLDGKSYLRYNLCGKLKQACGGFTNASVCLQNQNKQYVVGFENYSLISSDGLLSLIMLGEKCGNSEFDRRINVTFMCSFNVTKSGTVEVNVVRDECIYNMKITTPLACVSKLSGKDCSIVNENSIYNLTALSLANKNYEVKVPITKLIYSLNVCNPTLTTYKALCIMNTGVCVQNISEPNMKNRYYSAGATQKLVVKDNELQLHYKYGKLCSKSIDFSTVIHFKCSSNQEEKLTFLRESDCINEFRWITQHACPKKMQIPRSTMHECVIKGQFEQILNLTYVKPHNLELKIDENFTYTFNLCSDQYQRGIAGNERKEIGKITRYLRNKEDSTYIELKVNDMCIGNEVKTVQIHLTCDLRKENGYISQRSFINCTAVMEFNLLELCHAEIHQTASPVLSNIVTSEAPAPASAKWESEVNYAIVTTKYQNNCTVVYDELSINLNTIKPISILSSSGHNYTIGLHKNISSSPGYVWKEDKVIATLEECPTAKIEKLDILVNFSEYHGFSVGILFKCNITQKNPSIFEDEQQPVIIYPLWEVCTLRQYINNTVLTTTDKILIIFGVLIFLVIIIILVILRKRGFCFGYRRIPSNKSALELYCKNAED